MVKRNQSVINLQKYEQSKKKNPGNWETSQYVIKKGSG